MRWPLVMAPLPGEWLGFWIHRVAQPYGLDVPAVLREAAIRVEARPMVTWGRLPALGVPDLKCLRAFLGEPMPRLKAMQRRVSELGLSTQIGYCRACLLEDRQHGRPYYWRRDWMDPYIVWCARHRCRLSAVDACEIRPLRTGRETTQFLQSQVDEPELRNASAEPPDLVVHLRLQRRLQREAAVVMFGEAKPLRHLVDRIGFHPTPHLHAIETVDAAGPTPPGAIVRSWVPTGAGAFASVRSLEQRCALLRIVASVLMNARSDLRANLWESFSLYERDDVSTAILQAKAAGEAIDWPAAESHVKPALRRNNFRGPQAFIAADTDRKSSIASSL